MESRIFRNLYDGSFEFILSRLLSLFRLPARVRNRLIDTHGVMRELGALDALTV